ncbi:MAG: translation initiation factor IF-3 [Patescibacteria group bacterium]
MALTQTSYRLNQRIRSPQVRVIGEKGEQLGVMETGEALKIAQAQDLDLVEVAPNANPPVARILDFKKWLFQREKEEKKQPKTALKEFRVRPNIGEKDLQVRVGRAEKFLKAGHKVKLAVIFRGRERVHPELGLEKIKQVTEFLKGTGKPEKEPKSIGRGYEITFTPVK